MTTIDTAPKVTKPSLAVHLHLVWTLARKDIVDALKTKATLATIIISLLMVAFYRYLPAMTGDGNTLNVLLYAKSETAVTAALERSPALALYRYDSWDRLMEVFPDTEDVELAVVVPEAAASQEQDGGPITIDGYLMYWVSAQQRAEIKTLLEEELAPQLGRPVTLNLSGHDVFFDANTFFFAFTSTISLLFVTLMVGISVVPNLMVEEKRTRTLDMLLVSPASAAHLVAGKAIAGLFYGLLGSAIVLFAFRHLILRWDLAVLATVLATLFMVAIGLLLGSYLTVRAQLQLVAWLAALLFMVPVILVALEGLIPRGVVAFLNWIPTVLVAKIFRLALTPNATVANYGAAALVAAAATVGLLAVVVAIVRRHDRG